MNESLMKVMCLLVVALHMSDCNGMTDSQKDQLDDEFKNVMNRACADFLIEIPRNNIEDLRDISDSNQLIAIMEQNLPAVSENYDKFIGKLDALAAEFQKHLQLMKLSDTNSEDCYRQHNLLIRSRKLLIERKQTIEFLPKIVKRMKEVAQTQNVDAICQNKETGLQQDTTNT